MTQQYPPQQPPGGGYNPPPPQQPYGQQQPPQQPPYGQPVGGPGTPPGGMPGGGMPPQTPGGGMPQTPGYPPTPQKSKGKTIALVVVAVVVLAVIGFFVWQNSKTSPSSANAGDCIKVNSASASDADVEKIDCNAPDAVYKVGKKLDSTSADCPSDSYDKYTQSGKGDDFALCLMLNAKQGDCFADLTTSSGATARVPCTDPKAEGKVTKVVNGQAAESACPQDTGLALVYPEPGQTVCLVKAGEESGA